MGVHMHHLADGFRELGHDVNLLDYRTCRKRPLPWQAWSESTTQRVSRNTDHLMSALEGMRAEALLIAPAHAMFDYAELSHRFRGVTLFFDMDGPNLPCYRDGTDWIRDVDHLVTVSRITERELRDRGHSNVHYLPHGVDPTFYAPLRPSALRSKFAAPIASVASATRRRADYFAALAADDGVVLWGRDWARRPFKHDSRLSAFARPGSDVIGAELVEVYAAATVIASVQREVLSDPPTIMNLQVFAVPCSGGCLLTEWVEELEESFELGHEVLTFRSPEELAEQAQRYAKDPETARKIGERGRARCLAEHTQRHRAEAFCRWLGA